MSISTNTIKAWAKDLATNPTARLAGAILQNQPSDSLINRQSLIAHNVNHFNHVVDQEGGPVLDQKQSGRCWIFATTSVLRVALMKKFNLEGFCFSTTHLFFYDKLEKANFFLDQIVQTRAEPVDSRLVQHLLADPVQDGGQFDMLVSVICKYGLVPLDTFPEVHSSTDSRDMDERLTGVLRQGARDIRHAPTDAVEQVRADTLARFHKLLVAYLGQPLGPDDDFLWEYTDKDKKYGSVETTPLDFYANVVGIDLAGSISLVNDPRNPYNKPIVVERLGNVVGARPVTYLNLAVDQLARFAIKKIQNNQPVFFGNHSPLYMHIKRGIIDVDLWDHDLVGYSMSLDKADRLRYRESMMTHAMVFTAVHLDEVGNPVRWRVLNSWGDKDAHKGWYVMTHRAFEEYVYQVVVDKSDIGDLVQCLDETPTVLEPWDPMGALAACV